MKQLNSTMGATQMDTNNWITPPKIDAINLPRLYCFANAGGSSELFRQWQPPLDNTLAVSPIELPGRGRRLGESFCTSLLDAAAAAASEIAAAGPLPYCIFGHSLGSVLALETTRALIRIGHAPPHCIFLSGRVAPHIGTTNRQFHLHSDTEMVHELRRLGGTQEELLTDKAFLDFILPIVRNDYRLLETYTPQLQPKVNCPMHICCGDADTDAPPSLLPHWEELAEKSCQIKLFNGGHFYLNTEQSALMHYIKTTFLAYSQQH